MIKYDTDATKQTLTALASNLADIKPYLLTAQGLNLDPQPLGD